MSYEDVIVHEEEYKGFTIKIVVDRDPENPRSWDNAGTMACWHRRYDLGDIQPKERPHYFMKNITSKTHIILPLYLYDHSGISISTHGDRYPFNDRWDAGQLGWIYISRKDAAKEWGKKVCTKKVEKAAIACLQAEVETYNDYLNGNVYGYQVCDGEDVLDSCWGYYPDVDDSTGIGYAYCLSEAKDIADFYDMKKTQNIAVAQALDN